MLNKIPYLDSAPFFCGGTNGYKLSARVYLAGDGVGRGSFLSLYVSLMASTNDSVLPWPFKWRVSMVLVNQQQPGQYLIEEQFDPTSTSSTYQKPNKRNKGTGFPMFAKHDIVESPNCLVNDCIVIQIRADSQAIQDVRMLTQSEF